jgi:hypothetical protein
MADLPVETLEGAAVGARTLLARAAAADVHVQRQLEIACQDFFLPADARLDERMRSALGDLVRLLVATVERELREHGARLLASRGDSRLSQALSDGGSVLPRLRESGLLRDTEMMAELLGRVGLELLAQAMPMHGSVDPERPSLINRFAQSPDRVVAASAMAVLIAESQRRNLTEAGLLARSDLPADLHHRLVWWVAAALRESLADYEALDALDRALCEAAQRSLAAYDEADRPEAAAMRLAMAVDAHAGELPALLVEALGDRRVSLFVAFVAHGLGLGFSTIRTILLAPDPERLWVALRALGLARDTIAQLGYALSEADARRDLGRFAEQLDAIAAVSVEQARASLAPLKLPSEYRAALLALESTGAYP